jgi:hypothetical protein
VRALAVFLFLAGLACFAQPWLVPLGAGGVIGGAFLFDRAERAGPSSFEALLGAGVILLAAAGAVAVVFGLATAPA